MDLESVLEQAARLEFDVCLEFDPALLVPEQRIRDYCVENRCGSYNVNHMCPPRIGSLHDIAARLDKFGQGMLLRYSRPLDVANDREGVIRTKLEFHHLILRLERRLRKRGATPVWGLMGGNCELCRTCTAVQISHAAIRREPGPRWRRSG